jgi:hypothetical protein
MAYFILIHTLFCQTAQIEMFLDLIFGTSIEDGDQRDCTHNFFS